MRDNTKPTAAVILYEAKANSDKSLIRLRVTYQRKKKYYSFQMSATKEEWEKITNYKKLKASRSKDEIEALYIKVTDIDRKANAILADYERDSIPFSFQQFEQDYFAPKSKSVFEFIERINEKLLEKEQFGNYRIYKNLLDSLKKYTKDKDINFNQITTHFLKDYENFISKPQERKTSPKGNKQVNIKTSISKSTIAIRLRTLRAVYNEAISQNMVKQEQYPFKAFKIRGGSALKRALTKDQVLSIHTYNPEYGSPYWYSKNYFMFSYLCQGINFGDMAVLKWGNINGDRIEYQRKKTINTLKTPKIISIKISDEINSILALFGNSSKKGKDYIFPIIDKELTGKQLRDYILDKNKKHNEVLKEIGKELKIDLTLTSYVARHSYATVLKRSNVPTSVISESLGHSSESVTQNYLDSFDNSVIDDANKNLL